MRQRLSAEGVAAILAFYGKQKGNTPEQCLEFAEQVLGDKITILDSAKKSARKAADYQNPRVLPDALWKLGNEYLPAYLEGGDNKAKNIFAPSVYAAKESEQTMRNRDCIRQHTFLYNDKEVTMWQHLKFGVSPNKREQLRLYFYVDKEDKKIVIGHCGEHLDTIKTPSL